MFGTEGYDLWWLIPIALIVLCFFGARGCCSGRRHQNVDRIQRENEGTPGSALDILARRYARGEIDDVEYEKKRKALITQEQKGEPR